VAAAIIRNNDVQSVCTNLMPERMVWIKWTAHSHRTDIPIHYTQQSIYANPTEYVNELNGKYFKCRMNLTEDKHNNKDCLNSSKQQCRSFLRKHSLSGRRPVHTDCTVLCHLIKSIALNWYRL